jgi:biotin-dependent carboxylase-like uncharacterized protein
MSVTVVKAGLLSTLQSRPRLGLRHLGVAAGGAADPLSLALANRLVGNAWDAPAIEVTLAGPTLRFDTDISFAIAGGDAAAQLNGAALPCHQTVDAAAGDELVIGPVASGVRVYLAVAGGFVADELLGSASTSLQAGFGGYAGRALAAGDTVEGGKMACAHRATPAAFRPDYASAAALRTCPSVESAWLDEAGRAALYETNWSVDRRADRMGLRLAGASLRVASDGRMASAGVIPGTIQCPEDGRPYILSVDAGTIGGYPRVAQVARADRHVLGQLRPGDHVRLLPRTAEEAVGELRAKLDYWREWLPDIDEILA